MASPHATELPPASGFTPTQTAAIADLVHEATASAVDALRHELGRWHCYLALYLLGQIGVVLLSILMLQAMRDAPPLRSATMGAFPGISARPSTPIHSERRVNLPRFEMHQSETAALEQNSLPIVSLGIAPPRGGASRWTHSDSRADVAVCEGRADEGV